MANLPRRHIKRGDIKEDVRRGKNGPQNDVKLLPKGVKKPNLPKRRLKEKEVSDVKREGSKHNGVIIEIRLVDGWAKEKHGEPEEKAHVQFFAVSAGA